MAALEALYHTWNEFPCVILDSSQTKHDFESLLPSCFEYQHVCLQLPSPVAGNDVETPEGNVVNLMGLTLTDWCSMGFTLKRCAVSEWLLLC